MNPLTDIKTDLTVWIPPQTSDNFYENFHDFLHAHHEKQTLTLYAQYLWSYIVMRDQWMQAQVWIGPEGEIFMDETQIPAHLVSVVSLQAQFPNLQDFVDWCEANIKGFAWTSYRDRHYIVMELLQREHNMATAVEYACLSRTIPATIGQVFEYAPLDRNKEIVGVNDEMAKRLPTLAVALEEYDALPLEEKVEVVKEAARKYDEEKLAALREGIMPAQVAAGTKRELERKPLIQVVIPDDERYPYAIERTCWPDDDSGFGEGKVRTTYVQFVDGATGEVIKELPEPEAGWWMKKFRLGGPHGSHIQFAWRGCSDVIGLTKP